MEGPDGKDIWPSVREEIMTSSNIQKLLSLKKGEITQIKGVSVRYDGFWPDFPQHHQWTLLSSYIDSNQCERQYGSFDIEGLQEIGLVP